MANKRTTMVRHRISARVMPAFYQKFCGVMKALGLTQQDLIVQALDAEFNRLDLRLQCKVLTNANAALTQKKEGLITERNGLRAALKEVASKLGVPETAAHCLQRICEIEGQYQTLSDKLGVVECDRDTMQAARDSYEQERDAYQQGRDCFKGKYEGCQAELVVVKAKLLAYQTQGFWGRVLGRDPVV